MRYLLPLALAFLCGTVCADQQIQLVGTGTQTQQSQVQQIVQEFAEVTIQDAEVSWRPEVQYTDRQIQIPVPPRVQVIAQLRTQVPTYSVPLSSVPTVSVPTVTQQYSVPTATQTCVQYQPGVIQYGAPTVVQQAIPMQTVVQDVPIQYQTCTPGNCPPQMPNAGRHVIEYQRAQLGVNGQVVAQHNTPVRTLLKVRKALRDPPPSF